MIRITIYNDLQIYHNNDDDADFNFICKFTMTMIRRNYIGMFELGEDWEFLKPGLLEVSGAYVNSSFLVRMSSGGVRLVTAFGVVEQYAKPPPTIMSNVNTLCIFGQYT